MDNENNVSNVSTDNNYNQPQPMPNQNMSYDQPNVVMQSPKKNKLLVIIICVIIILALAFGGYLIATGIFDTKNKELTENEKLETIDKTEHEQETLSLYEYSLYQNYNFTMNITMGYSSGSVSTSSTGTADVKNRTSYMETVVKYGDYSYTSYDYSNYAVGTSYTSDDKINWETSTVTGSEPIELEDIIDKINSNSSDVEVISSNHYSVLIDLDSYGSVEADVYTNDGYITALSYDLTSLVASEGYSEFKISFTLSDFNTAGDVIIPSSVVNSSSSST